MQPRTTFLLHLSPLLLEGGELELPIVDSSPNRFPTIPFALVPELHALGGNERADQLVVFLLARVAAERFPGVMAFADADDEARVGECRAVVSWDEVIGLKHKLAVVRVPV